MKIMCQGCKFPKVSQSYLCTTTVRTSFMLATRKMNYVDGILVKVSPSIVEEHSPNHVSGNQGKGNFVSEKNLKVVEGIA